MAHDVGGICVAMLDKNGAIDFSERPMSQWELSVHALLVELAVKSLITTDELRRGVESLEEKAYKSWGYYDRWSASMALILIERGVINESEIDELLDKDDPGIDAEKTPAAHQIGDYVVVRHELSKLRWKKPHIRCPGYIFGKRGRVVKYVGAFQDPFLLSFRKRGPKQHLYIVAFPLQSLLRETPAASSVSELDEIEVEIYEPWLISDNSCVDNHDQHNHSHQHQHKHEHEHEHEHAHAHEHQGNNCCANEDSHQHQHQHQHEHNHNQDKNSNNNHDHDHHHQHSSEPHDHGHEHHHENRLVIEQRAAERESAPSPGEVVGRVLIELLIKKGVIDRVSLQETMRKLESNHTEMKGALLVAMAWKDKQFKELLLKDPATAALQIGVNTSNPNAPTVLRVIANTPETHHAVVCTLCSCYPAALLGFSPAWYKSRNYRARMVSEPREVLREFGVNIDSNRRLIVHDSTADCRYLVLPLPPKHLTVEQIQSMTIEELRALVTRDSMIGVQEL